MIFSYDKDILAAALRARDKARGDKHKQAAKERKMLPREVIKNDPVLERRVNRFFAALCVAGIVGVLVAVKLGWIF